MGKTLLLLALLFPFTASATIFPIFNKNGNQATLMITGLAANPEGLRLFETLAAGQQDEQGKFTKKVKFVDKNGVQAFSVVCVFSKLVQNNGTCTVVFAAAESMDIRLNEKTVTYDLRDPKEAAGMVALFNATTAGEIYRTDNGRFVISAERNAAGEVTRALLSYR